MVVGLKRYQNVGDLHFVTFSCYRRHAYLRAPVARELFEDGLDRVRQRYEFEVVGYVVMPEHVHLLLSEPQRESSSDRAVPLRPKAGLGGRPASSVPVQLSPSAALRAGSTGHGWVSRHRTRR